MESTTAAELRHRLVAGVVLATATGLFVAVCGHLAASPDRGTATYVVPNQHEASTDGQVLTGLIHDPRHIPDPGAERG